MSRVLLVLGWFWHLHITRLLLVCHVVNLFLSAFLSFSSLFSAPFPLSFSPSHRSWDRYDIDKDRAPAVRQHLQADVGVVVVGGSPSLRDAVVDE